MLIYHTNTIPGHLSFPSFPTALYELLSPISRPTISLLPDYSNASLPHSSLNYTFSKSNFYTLTPTFPFAIFFYSTSPPFSLLSFALLSLWRRAPKPSVLSVIRSFLSVFSLHYTHTYTWHNCICQTCMYVCWWCVSSLYPSSRLYLCMIMEHYKPW